MGPLLSAPEMPDWLLVGTGSKLVVSFLLLGPEAEITPPVTEPPLRAGDSWTQHFWLGPGYWTRLGK